MSEEHEGHMGFWSRVGGRKTFNGWLALIALTLMAIPLEATFLGYAAAVLTGLGITSSLTATEDIFRAREQNRESTE